MSWRYLLLILIVIVSTSCSEKRTAVETTGESVMLSRQEAEYLAYEHSLTVDVKEEDLSQAYESTLYACVNDRDNNCTILDSRISSGTNPFASVRLRIKPEGVERVTTIASSKGKLVQKSTRVEDLAKPVLDNVQRLKMLESHRDNLLALQEKAKDDVDSLIKVSSELSRVLSDIEQAKGQEAFLSQRINMEVVNIYYQVRLSRSFWKPISNSFSEFSNNLSDGISGTIVAVAYLLPGVILLMIVFSVIRFVWKRKSKKRS